MTTDRAKTSEQLVGLPHADIDAGIGCKDRKPTFSRLNAPERSTIYRVETMEFALIQRGTVFWNVIAGASVMQGPDLIIA